MDNRQRIFTKNLRHYTNKSGKQHKEICQALHILPSTFSTWINGKAIPRMDKMQLLATFFNCSISDLLEEKTNETIEAPDPTMTLNGTEMRALLVAYSLIKDPELKETIEKISQLNAEQLDIIKRLVDSMSKGV